VHDFVVLVGSMRRDGKSLAEMARAEIGPTAGLIAGFAIFGIVTIAIAAMALVVVNSLAKSAWGTFTIGSTIPVALLMGVYMYKLRPGKIGEASAIGVVLLLLAVVGGKHVADSSWSHLFIFSEHGLTIALALYGICASVLPVWILLCPRDYLSSYMKLGTIVFLIVGLLVVNPELKIPPISQFANGGPLTPGGIFPFVFITIACGAISGFHGLIGSGTTPKMIDRESHARMIGYGAMLCEGLVGVVALIAAASLSQGDYFAINTSPKVFGTLGLSMDHLPELSQAIGEDLRGRAGGAVSLAVGISQVFAGLPGMKTLISYWYHFAIMFEALFVLTTVDSGTRVARFLVQDVGGRFMPKFAKTDWLPGTVISTLLVVAAWTSLVWSGSIKDLWPMLGISNQLLACIALCTGTTMIVNAGRGRYAWVTLVPFVFVSIATQTAGVQMITRKFIPAIHGADRSQAVLGAVLLVLCVLSMLAMLLILAEALPHWLRAWRQRGSAVAPAETA
jgi:carbon starvation protein